MADKKIITWGEVKSICGLTGNPGDSKLCPTKETLLAYNNTEHKIKLANDSSYTEKQLIRWEDVSWLSYSVTLNKFGTTNKIKVSNSSDTAHSEAPYSNIISIDGYREGDPLPAYEFLNNNTTVSMGKVDITSQAVDDVVHYYQHNVNITSVTGDIVIKANAVKTPVITTNLSKCSISPDIKSIHYGLNYTATITASGNAHLSECIVDGIPQEINKDTPNIITIHKNNVTSDINITASAKHRYKIYTTFTGCAIDPDAEIPNWDPSTKTGWYYEGDPVVFNYTRLNSHYKTSPTLVKVVDVNGKTITNAGAEGTIQLAPTTNKDVYITITYDKIPIAISYNLFTNTVAGQSGFTISNSAKASEHGDPYVSTFTIKSGYVWDGTITYTHAGSIHNAESLGNGAYKINIPSLSSDVTINAKALQVFTVKATSYSHMTIGTPSTTVLYGGTYTTTASPNTGYNFPAGNLVVTGTHSSKSYSGGKITISGIKSNITYTAIANLNAYTVTLTGIGSGTHVTGDNNQTSIHHFDKYSLNLEADLHYEFLSCTAKMDGGGTITTNNDGVRFRSINSQSVTGNITVTANAVKQPYVQITAPGCIVTGVSTGYIDYNSNINAFIKPSPGHKITSKPTVSGVDASKVTITLDTVTGGYSVSIKNVTKNVSINANGLVLYTITSNLTGCTWDNPVHSPVTAGSQFNNQLNVLQYYNEDSGVVSIMMGDTNVSQYYDPVSKAINFPLSTGITDNVVITATFDRITYNASKTLYTDGVSSASGFKVNVPTGTIEAGRTYAADLSLASSEYEWVNTPTYTHAGQSGKFTLSGSKYVLNINPIVGNITVSSKVRHTARTITGTYTSCSTNNTNKSIAYGESYSATITPITGYHLYSATITMGGTNITSSAWTQSTGKINISKVTGNIVIKITAVINKYEVNTTATNCSITPTNEIVNYNGTYIGEVGINPGYTLSKSNISASGTHSGIQYEANSNSLRIDNIKSNVNISATAQKIYYSVSHNTGNFTINVPSSVAWGNSVKATIKPNTGYEISSVTATQAGVSKPVSWSGNEATISDVKGDIIITVNAVIRTFTVTIGDHVGTNISTTSATVNYNSTFTRKASALTGYTLSTSNITATGTHGTISYSNGNITIPNITSDVTVNINATLNTYNITYSLTGEYKDVIKPTTVQHGKLAKAVFELKDPKTSEWVNLKTTMAGVNHPENLYSDDVNAGFEYTSATGPITFHAYARHIPQITYTYNSTHVKLDPKPSSVPYDGSVRIVASPISQKVRLISAAITGGTATQSGKNWILTANNVTKDIKVEVKSGAGYILHLNLTGCSVDSHYDGEFIDAGDPLRIGFSPDEFYDLSENNIHIKMGGRDITHTALDFSTSSITINSVTGDVEITMTATRPSYDIIIRNGTNITTLIPIDKVVTTLPSKVFKGESVSGTVTIPETHDLTSATWNQHNGNVWHNEELSYQRINNKDVITVNKSNIQDNCFVTIKGTKRKAKYPVTYNLTNCTIHPNLSELTEGENYTFAIIPTSSDFSVDNISIKVNGKINPSGIVEISSNLDQFSINHPNGPVEITVNAVKVPVYTITRNLGPGCTLSNQNTTIKKGTAYTSIINIDPSKVLKSVTITVGGTAGNYVSGNNINIPGNKVTGNIVITITTADKPAVDDEVWIKFVPNADTEMRYMVNKSGVITQTTPVTLTDCMFDDSGGSQSGYVDRILINNNRGVVQVPDIPMPPVTSIYEVGDVDPIYIKVDNVKYYVKVLNENDEIIYPKPTPTMVSITYNKTYCSISPTPATMAQNGLQIFTITPNNGYVLDTASNYTVNGVKHNITTTSFTISNPSGDIVINAIAKRKPTPVTKDVWLQFIEDGRGGYSDWELIDNNTQQRIAAPTNLTATLDWEAYDSRDPENPSDNGEYILNINKGSNTGPLDIYYQGDELYIFGGTISPKTYTDASTNITYKFNIG